VAGKIISINRFLESVYILDNQGVLVQNDAREKYSELFNQRSEKVKAIANTINRCYCQLVADQEGAYVVDLSNRLQETADFCK